MSLVVLILGAMAVSCGPSPGPTEASSAAAASSVTFAGEAPVFDESFWSTWGDGKAELAGYDLTFPRYGETRQGVAVTIFVTETFSNSLRVKADPGKHPPRDEFPVMKLNLIQDFPTGIYDYNEMTSRFVALEPVNGRPAGALTKVSFSSQEWCGHVWHQLLFDPESIRFVSHSYFDGEADQSGTLDYPAEGLPADALHHWARGMAYPALEPGETAEVPYLPTVQSSRHGHKALKWTTATLTRAASPERVTVPAGEFETEKLEARTAGGVTYTFYVESAPPRRIIRWASSAGEQGSLLASERLKYWEMNGPDYEDSLSRLGLKKRPPRTP